MPSKFWLSRRQMSDVDVSKLSFGYSLGLVMTGEQCHELQNHHVIAIRTSTHQMQTITLTRGRTDHFAAGVTHLQFPIQVCFFSTLLYLVLPVSLFQFQPKTNVFPPVTLSVDQWPWVGDHELLLQKVKLKYHVKYLGERWFRSTFIMRTQTHTADGPQSWTTK